jgi:hypothetical protein
MAPASSRVARARARRRGLFGGFWQSGGVPAILGPLVGFVLGVAFGWIRASEPEGRSKAPDGISLTALFGALVYAPVNAYFLAFAGDWSLSYTLDSQDVPSALLLLLVVADAALVPAGFALAVRRARSRSLGGVIVLGAVPGAIALVALLASHQRLAVDATYQQYRLDFGTQPVAGGSLGYALLWMLAMLCAGFVVTARALRGRATGSAGASAAAPRAHLGAGAPPPDRRG